MQFTHTLLALGLAALPASALALDGTDANDDAAALVQKLGDRDYKVRRDAYKQLEKLGAEARAALETAAKSDDAEVRWNASRLLDHLDPQSGGLKERVDPALQEDAPQSGAFRSRGVPRDLQQQMRELEKRIHELQQRFSQDNFDLFRVQDGSDPLQSFGQGFGPGLRQGWVQGFGNGGELELGPGSSFSRSTTSNGQTESFTLRVDQEGHVTAEEQKDGKTTKYEADSLDALKKEHPELLQRGPVTVAIRPFSVRVQGQGPGQRQSVVIPGLPAPAPDTSTVTPKKKGKTAKVKAPKVETVDPGQVAEGVDVLPAQKPRLGVELAPVAPDLAEYLELDGDAFQIVRVVDDTPAKKRGLKSRDILLEVNGKEVHAFDDVVKALEGADPNEVKIVVLRRGQRKEL